MKTLIISIFFFIVSVLPAWGWGLDYDPNERLRPYSQNTEDQLRDIQLQLEEMRLEMDQQRIQDQIDRLNRNNCDCDCW
jgi:hypothetical protein